MDFEKVHSKVLFWAKNGPNWARFGPDLGQILAGFWSDFDQILAGFWPDFGRGSPGSPWGAPGSFGSTDPWVLGPLGPWVPGSLGPGFVFSISGKCAKKMREGRFPPFGFEWKGFELWAASLAQFLAFFDFWKMGQKDARGSISPLRVQMEGV